MRVVAPARYSSFGKAAALAAELLPSGLVAWGLDDDDAISQLYLLPGQPVSVLVYQGVEVHRWIGPAPEGAWQESTGELLDLLG